MTVLRIVGESPAGGESIVTMTVRPELGLAVGSVVKLISVQPVYFSVSFLSISSIVISPFSHRQNLFQSVIKLVINIYGPCRSLEYAAAPNKIKNTAVGNAIPVVVSSN